MSNERAASMETAAAMVADDGLPADDPRNAAAAILLDCAKHLREREAAITDDLVDCAILAHEGVRSIPRGGWGDRQRERMRAAIEAVATMLASAQKPIPLILHCPSCHVQHIDNIEWSEEGPGGCGPITWNNPPHRSHLCHRCGTIWRPADVATVGVEKIQTQGKNDVVMPAPMVSARVPDVELKALKNLAYDMRQLSGNNNRLTHIGWAQRVERVISVLATAPKHGEGKA